MDYVQSWHLRYVAKSGVVSRLRAQNDASHDRPRCFRALMGAEQWAPACTAQVERPHLAIHSTLPPPVPLPPPSLCRYGSHCNSPKKHEMGQAMAKRGLCVYQMDIEGHGYSGGVRAYIEDHSHLVEDFLQVRAAERGWAWARRWQSPREQLRLARATTAGSSESRKSWDHN